MRLVVDVNIVHSSGGITAIHSTALKCREVLLTIYENQHKIVISSDLRHECVRHATPFSVSWYYQMKRNNLIEDIHDVRDETLREKILGCFPSDSVKKKVKKDIHLIEAALKTDKKILSNDQKERKKYCHASSSVTELNAIIWVNHLKNHDQVVNWLRCGASCSSAPHNWFLQ